LSHSTSPFLCFFFFWDGSWNYLPSWLQISIPLISASWVARIIGMDHWCQAVWSFWILISYGLCRVNRRTLVLFQVQLVCNNIMYNIIKTENFKNASFSEFLKIFEVMFFKHFRERRT
jgi:hypothetical protein